MSTQIEIINRALSYLGANPITALNDGSTEADVMSAVYDGIRDVVMEAREWAFATARIELAKDVATPPFGFGSQFSLPSNVLRILDVRSDTGESRLTYNSLDWVREGDKIYCDAERAFCRYLKRITDTSLYPPSFQQALVARLAAETSITFTESSTVRKEMWSLYGQAIAEATSLDSLQGRSARIRAPWISAARGMGGGKDMGPEV